MGLVTNVVVSGLLGGGLVLGALVTYDGSETLNKAKERIIEQAQEMNLIGQQQEGMVGKITEMKDRLAYLEENGTDKDQAEIDSLKAKIATYETNVNTGAEQIVERVNALEAEIQKANTEAAELQTTMDSNVVTASALSAYDFDDVMGTLPTDAIKLEMINGTPQIVYDFDNNATGLVIDKNLEQAEPRLIIQNNAALSFFVYVDGVEYTVENGTVEDLGKVADLVGSKLTFKDAYGRVVKGTYYLQATDL